MAVNCVNVMIDIIICRYRVSGTSQGYVSGEIDSNFSCSFELLFFDCQFYINC